MFLFKVQLSEGLAIEAQKALTTLLCYGADKRIRLKFIEGCLRNVERNEGVVVSLRLLPKLLNSFSCRGLGGGGDIHQVSECGKRCVFKEITERNVFILLNNLLFFR